MTTDSTPVLEGLRALHERLSLRDVRCVESSARLAGDAPVQADEAVVSYAPPKYLLRADEGVFSGWFDAELTYLAEGGSVIATVSAAFVVEFELAPGPELEVDTVTTYLRTNAFFFAFPYIREALHGGALRVGMPPVLLPFLDRSTPMPQEVRYRPAEFAGDPA